ncbi:MAG: beta-aspartyl-dipeptidase (metallo-type) [Lysobacterales bacterium]|jgi:beta-aspartyl-dipeptidase (metallo-type)
MFTLITNADIYSPEALGIGHVLTGGGKILYVGATLPQVDRALISGTIDLEGGKLIPGLIDAHVHSTGGGGENGFASQVPAVDLSQFTRFGVTSVVGLLGADDETRSTSNLLARTRALREEGLSAWCWTGGYHLPLTTLTGSARKDIVNIDCVIGIGELAISDHRSSQPTFDELARIASEVYTAGMISGKAGILHLHLGDGDRGLELISRLISETELPARMFHPTHVNRQKALFNEACELGRQGVTIDVTAFPVQGEDELSAEDAWVLFTERNGNPNRITVSSDSGGCLPQFDENKNLLAMGIGTSAALPAWVSHLVQKNHSLEKVLPAVTSNVADLLKLHGKGRIIAGADADLVCLDNNLQPIHVMALGQWMVRDAVVLVKGNFEN